MGLLDNTEGSWSDMTRFGMVPFRSFTGRRRLSCLRCRSRPAYSSDLKERTDMRWCNGGTFGDHGCEDLGYHTYCCSMSASSDDFFNSPRDVIVASKNPQHGTDCANKGKVYCAK
ncbi:hypothetical protein E4U49_000508 [Claviceps purpurea]|nr:hypothetical protein E4U49_000508 [Claviceps purpurea]